MTKQRLFLLQLALEASIPLMGYFLWEWGLYFILLFYFLDILASEWIMHLKSKRTANFKNTAEPRRNWLFKGLLSAGLVLVVIFLIHFAMITYQPSINFVDEIISFWNYEDLGIKQGYLFVPLVLLLNWQQYRMEFLITAKYRTADMLQLWNGHLSGNLIILFGAIFSLLIIYLTNLEELVYIISIVTGIIIYRLVSNYR